MYDAVNHFLSCQCSVNVVDSVVQGWYIVTYAIGIFMLNQFIAFLTPKIDPAMRDYEGVYCLV